MLPVAAECLAIRDAFIRYLTSENLVNNPDADEQQVYDHCAKWVDAMCQTPATDRIVAEAEARGVEKAIECIVQTITPNHETILKEFAQQLREGAE